MEEVVVVDEDVDEGVAFGLPLTVPVDGTGAGASESDQVMLSRFLGDTGVESMGKGADGSMRSATVVKAASSKTISSNSISGASSLKAPMDKSIDPYSQSSQTPTICA